MKAVASFVICWTPTEIAANADFNLVEVSGDVEKQACLDEIASLDKLPEPPEVMTRLIYREVVVSTVWKVLTLDELKRKVAALKTEEEERKKRVEAGQRKARLRLSPNYMPGDEDEE